MGLPKGATQRGEPPLWFERALVASMTPIVPDYQATRGRCSDGPATSTTPTPARALLKGSRISA